MKKLLAILVLGLLWSHSVLAEPKKRSEKEIKMGVFLEDLKIIGKYKKIEEFPVGLFDSKYKSFAARSKFSQSEVARIFVKQKGLLTKYPERMMLGMAYFEFFYQQQLKDNKRSINNFIENYPTWDTANIASIQKIYSLNEARRTMREALGLKIDDESKKVLNTFYTMSMLFEGAEIKTVKLSKEEKKKIKANATIIKSLGSVKKLVERYKDQRINEKKFNKEFKKNYKKLETTLKKNEKYKEYELLTSFVAELPDLMNKDLSATISGYRLAEFISKDLKKNNLPKKFTHDLSKADFSNFNQDQLKALGEVTKFTKLNKNINSNKIQIDILNIEENGIPVNKLLDVYRMDLKVNLDSLNMQLSSAENMNRWAKSDWANAWKSPIPTKIQDAAGIEISLSDEQIQEVKAQLSMQNFREIINIEDFKDVISEDALSDIQTTVSKTTESFNFSFTLDDFAQALGDLRDLDINNYADLTALANAQYGADWSVEEYASAYQGNLDVIEQLASGSLSDFDAGALAEAAGSSLQDVADTIAAASAAGVTVDLDATFQGMGYDDFASAVAAYNAEHGTNYTVQEARDALGQ
jgi:predicted nucleic acid-binding protein